MYNWGGGFMCKKEKYKSIQINAAIFPRVMSIAMSSEPVVPENIDNENIVYDMSIELPRGANLLYLQKIADEQLSEELELLEKYSYGVAFSDEEYRTLIKQIMNPTPRNRSIGENMDIASAFGIVIEKDNAGKSKFALQADAIEAIKADTWECIIMDVLHESAYSILELFDFEKFFHRKHSNSSNIEPLLISFGSWQFTSDVAEQKLSNALRTALIFTLVGYYTNQRIEQYDKFQDYFEEEFYKRVSLVYGIWSSIEDNSEIKYIPLYDSFYNLTGMTKDELIGDLKAILDSDEIALDDKKTLKEQLVVGAGEFHSTQNHLQLEQDLIKPAINMIALREKSKESIEAAELLYEQKLYNDLANRCYYAAMYALKALLEHEQKLANWKTNELKERESHDSLERGLVELVQSGMMDAEDKGDFEYIKDNRWKCDYSLFKFTQSDAALCLDKAKKFCNKVETKLFE